MAPPGHRDPRWVDAVLQWPGTWLLARIGLTAPYWIGGLAKWLDFNGAVAEQLHFGLRPPVVFALATIAVELGASALIIAGRWVWLGAGALAVFTAIATLIAHAFWTLQGIERFMAFNSFFEHLGLIAGLVMAALIAEREQREAAR